MHIFSHHQTEQVKVIDALEERVRGNGGGFTTVAPVEDYANDPRHCLTTLHFPARNLLEQIQQALIAPLQAIEPSFFFYPTESLHLTVKNIRVINDPPHFSPEDIRTAQVVCDTVFPRHHAFQVYFYRLLLFQNNLALIGTTDAELDSLVHDLDTELNLANLPDDKTYINSEHFFNNMTLARFNSSPSAEFLEKVQELSSAISFEPYTIDTIALVRGNAVFAQKEVIQTWPLKRVEGSR